MPIEVGIDLTPLFDYLDGVKDGDAKLFLSMNGAGRGEFEGVLYECGIRNYDYEGAFLRETKVKVGEGDFSKSPIQIYTTVESPGRS
jgi:hypothetical protein